MNADGRLRWRCRRGTLEMDLLLNHFLDQANGYAALSEAQRQAFDRLLDEADADLSKWIFGGASPTQPELRDAVEQIRRAATA